MLSILKPMRSTKSASRRALAYASLAFPLLLVCGSLKSQTVFPMISDGSYDYTNWISVSAGGVDVSGDNAAFLQRHGLKRDFFGGIEDFHFERDVGNNSLLVIEGRGLIDNNDYRFTLDFTNEDKGFIRAGFREYRIWYDGSGGYAPQNGQFFSLYDEDLGMNRGEAWIEAGLTGWDGPNITFKYTRKYRKGLKSSTSWGSSNLTGDFGQRSISPTFLDIDEERDIIEAEVSDNLGNTDWALGLRYEASNYSDARKIRRNPEESSDRYLTQREDSESDSFTIHGYTRTQLNESVYFTTGAFYTKIDTNLTGNRIYGSDYDAVYDLSYQRQNRDEGFVNLTGNTNMEQFIFNFNIVYALQKNLSMVAALRLEKLDLDASTDFIETNYVSGNASEDELAIGSTRDWDDLSGSLEFRYTGKPNWVFSAGGFWSSGDGEMTEQEIEVAESSIELDRITAYDRTAQKYTLGAKWYPDTRLHFAAQYYHKIRENDFDNTLDPTSSTGGDRLPAYYTAQDFTTDDFNFRMTWRAHSTLSAVSRYDYQKSTIDTTGDGLSTNESANHKSHIFSETVTWTPQARFYFQGNFNYVEDRTSTGAESQTGGAEGLVQESLNDYWDAGLTASIALDDTTDLQARYSYRRADNYRDNSTFSQPYGADYKEHGVTLSFAKRINENLRYTVQYGFYNNRELTAGGNNNYDAHVLYTNLQYRF